jgi:hypothetical protein
MPTLLTVIILQHNTRLYIVLKGTVCDSSQNNEAAGDGCTNTAFLAAPAQLGNYSLISFPPLTKVRWVRSTSSGKVSWEL